MFRLVFVLFLVLVTNSFFSQESEENQANSETKFRVGGSIKLALIPYRTLFFPEEIKLSNFYKEQFDKVPSLSLITRGTATFQFNANDAVIKKNKNVAFEFGLNAGY